MDTNNRNNDKSREETKIHLTNDSTLQTREEKDRDNQVDPREDRTIGVSEDDLNDAKAGRLTGREEADRNETEDRNEDNGSISDDGRGIVDRNIQ